MKQKRLKKNLKLKLLLVSCLTLFWQCYDDIEEENTISNIQITANESKVSSRMLKGKEARNIAEMLSPTINDNFNLDTGMSYRSETEGSTIGVVDYENILEVIDSAGIANYTFKIINHPDDTENIFHNLVISDDGTEQKVTLIKYEYENDSERLGNFEGKITTKKYSGSDVCDETTMNADFNTGTFSPSEGSGSNAGATSPPLPGTGTTEPPESGTIGTGGSGGTNGVTVSDVTTIFDCNTCSLTASTYTEFSDHRDEDGEVYQYTVIIIFHRMVDLNEDPNPCDTDGAIGIIDDVEESDCDTSKDDLKKVFPNMSDTNASTLAFVINDKGEDFGIDTKEKLQHFLSQAGHEVGGFNNGFGIEESTNYSTEARLLQIFGKYYSETDTINKRKPDTYVSNPTGHANYVYCCRMGNGDEASGDGYKYRGRGIFQLTGKTNYTNFKSWYNDKYDPDKDFVDSPQLLKDNDTIAILSALWYYKTSVLDKITVDSTTTVKKVTKKVNGGTNGLSDRKELFTKAKDSIDCK